MIEQLLVFIASYFANTMSALAGGGAGLVQLPVILWMGLAFPVALATHKTASLFLGLGAMVRIAKEKGLLDVRFCLYMLIAGTLGVILGAYIIIQVPDKIATVSLGVLTIGLGLYSFVKKEMGQEYLPKNRNLTGFVVGGFGLFLLGVLNGSLTAGTGLFVTVWLIIWFGMDYKRAVASVMLVVGLFWNGTGAVTLIVMGEPLHLPWLPVLIVGSLLGGYTGAHLGMLKGNKWIKIAFVSVTLLSGVSLLFK